jgi:hypothetical protein
MNINRTTSRTFQPVDGSLKIPKEISALEILSTNTGVRSGQITAIPKNTYVQVCGRGFNERTIQVRWNERLCYVFLQDIESAESSDKSLSH